MAVVAEILQKLDVAELGSHSRWSMQSDFGDAIPSIFGVLGASSKDQGGNVIM
jgi:hypothetical protein